MYRVIFLLFFFFSSIPAYALQPTAPELRIPVGNDATVRTLPKVSYKMNELIVRGCDRNLSDMLDGLHSKSIRSLFAFNVGESTWLVRLVLKDEKAHIDAVVTNGGLELWVRSEDDVDLMRPPFSAVPTVADLFDNEWREMAQENLYPPQIPLRFLYGSAMSYQMSSKEVISDIGQPREVMGEVSWKDINKAHSRYIDALSQGQTYLVERGNAAYTLGWTYMKMGMSREASYYFNQLIATPGNISPLYISMAQAKSEIQKGNWSEAETLLRRAYFLGGDEAAIAEEMAYISMATNSPPRGSLGLLLSNLTSRPESQLIAGELMQMAGMYEESLTVLRPLFDENYFMDQPKLQERLALRLGDASLVVGELDAAKKYWLLAPDDLNSVRQTLALMLEKGTEYWVQSIPTLYQTSQTSSYEARAEATYLIAQINTSLGTRKESMILWANFMEDYPELSKKTDVGDILWRMYSQRIRTLTKQEDWKEIVENHELIWSNELENFIDEPLVLVYVADAYKKMGFTQDALMVLFIGFRALNARNIYAPDLLLDLAEMYGEIDRAQDGLSTLDILEQRTVPNYMVGQIAYLRAHLYEDLQDLDNAETYYRQAMRSSKIADIARFDLASMFAENQMCGKAVGLTSGVFVQRPSIQEVTSPLPFLNLAQCFLERGRKTEGIVLLNYSQERAVTEDERLRARYLLAEYGDPDSIELKEGEEETLWGALIKENQDMKKFEREFKEWKDKTK